MEFKTYSEKAKSTAIFPESTSNVYPMLGLLAESSEIAERLIKPFQRAGLGVNSISQDLIVMQLEEFVRAGKALEKFAKDLRDKKAGDKPDNKWVETVNYTKEEKDGINSEISDQLWFQAYIAELLDSNLDNVAQYNLAKLAKRKTKGTLGGSGDSR